MAENEEVQEQEGTGEVAETFTLEQVEDLVKERLAEAKAENDTAFGKLWEEGKAAKERAKTLEAELATIKEERQAGKAGLTSEQLDKLRADVRKNLDGEYAPVIEERDGLKSQVEALTGEVRGLRLDSKIKAQMGEMGVRSDRIEKLFKLTKDQYDLTDDGVPVLKDEPTADIGQYISETLRSEYPEWFNGSGSSGGGASRSTVGGGGKTVIPAGDGDAFMANIDKIASGEVEVR